SLTLQQSMIDSTEDYRDCIDRFLSAGVGLTNYNSFSVARDVETLRQAAGIEQWVLYGVSYGANYAMAIAANYPNAVESMILDSSFVSGIGLHEYYIEQTVRPFQMLYDYCVYDPNCVRPIDNFKERFWAVYRSLNDQPIWVDLFDIGGTSTVPVLLDGERFLSSVMEGAYDVQIFSDLPKIIIELENGDIEALGWYLWLHVDYLLDTKWGDVSAMTHYCYEQKPQIDYSKIREQFDQLPSGYLRDNAPLALDWPDLCEQMQFRNNELHLVPGKQISVPTLFLHGNLDIVTPLSNVRRVLHYFERAHLLTFNLGHGILGYSYCASNSIEIFVKNPNVTRQQIACP
ncbi:MAG: alpha/beta hydrolase, partial [Desulfobulbia bacterium]